MNVRPVKSLGSSDVVKIEVRSFNSPQVPIKKQYLQFNEDSAQINAINNRINEIAISRYIRRYGGGGINRKVIML